MNPLGVISQLLAIIVALALAPLLTGWVNQWRAWLQNKSAPSLLRFLRTGFWYGIRILRARVRRID